MTLACANFLGAKENDSLAQYYGTWGEGTVRIMGGTYDAEIEIGENILRITKGREREYTYLTWTKNENGHTVLEGRDEKRKTRAKPVVTVTFKEENGITKAFMVINAMGGFVSTGLTKIN